MESTPSIPLYGCVGFVIKAVNHNAVALSAVPTRLHTISTSLFSVWLKSFLDCGLVLFFSREQSHFHGKDRSLDIHDLHQIVNGCKSSNRKTTNSVATQFGGLTQ